MDSRLAPLALDFAYTYTLPDSGVGWAFLLLLLAVVSYVLTRGSVSGLEILTHQLRGVVGLFVVVGLLLAWNTVKDEPISGRAVSGTIQIVPPQDDVADVEPETLPYHTHSGSTGVDFFSHSHGPIPDHIYDD